METLKSCKGEGEAPEEIFNDVAESPETLRFEEFKAVARPKGKGQMVEVLVLVNEGRMRRC